MINKRNGYHKIGISENPIYREKTLQGEEPQIETIMFRKFVNRKVAREIEKKLHEEYKTKRVRGEWFDLNAIEVKFIIKNLK